MWNLTDEAIRNRVWHVEPEHQLSYMDLLSAFKISSVSLHAVKSANCDTSMSQILNIPSIRAPFSHRRKKDSSALGVPFIEYFRSAFTDLLPQGQRHLYNATFLLWRVAKTNWPEVRIWDAESWVYTPRLWAGSILVLTHSSRHYWTSNSEVYHLYRFIEHCARIGIPKDLQSHIVNLVFHIILSVYAEKLQLVPCWVSDDA